MQYVILWIFRSVECFGSSTISQLHKCFFMAEYYSIVWMDPFGLSICPWMVIWVISIRGFFFWPCSQHVEVPGPGIKPMPQWPPEPKQ